MTVQIFWLDRRQYRRTFSGTALRRRALVESEHPGLGWLTRGTIRCCGLDDTTAPGLAGHHIWQPVTHDGLWLDRIADDYREAERVLLEATKTLDD